MREEGRGAGGGEEEEGGGEGRSRGCAAAGKKTMTLRHMWGTKTLRATWWARQGTAERPMHSLVPILYASIQIEIADTTSAGIESSA